jgi:hypothetical protein
MDHAHRIMAASRNVIHAATAYANLDLLSAVPQ